jgi:hypothetical protein
MNKNDTNNGLGWPVWTSITIAAICIIVGIAAGVCGFLIPRSGNDPMNDWGNLGSFLQGTTASFWALAGVFIIFVAFIAQNQQLTLQQKQFRQESFENHFFQLLALHNDIVDDLQIENCEAKGRSNFASFYRMVSSTYNDRVNGPAECDTEALAVGCYEAVFDEQPEVLGHYFRNLYHIIRFVDESGISEKKRYTSIVRAQLSSYEHVLLHYNGLGGYGAEKFKRLIEEYALLENMGPGILLNPKHSTSYSRKAFGEDADQFAFPSVSPGSE